MTTTTTTTSTVTLTEIVAETIATNRFGDYQLAVLGGSRRWSGADLSGKARQYGGRYKRSRDLALDAVRAVAARHGVKVALVGGTAKAGPLTLAIVG